MANTFTLIEAKTLTTATTSITFSSILQTFTDLKLLASARNDRTGEVSDDFRITINGNTAATYANNRLTGNGTTVYSDGGSGSWPTYAYFGVLNSVNSTGNVFGNTEFYFPNYTTSGIYKSISVDGIGENNASVAQVSLYAGLISDTNPITSIKLESHNATNFVTYSTFYLYGIKNS